MTQTFVPVLILATVALSSSTILPLLSKNLLDAETIDTDGQERDNTISNKLKISLHLPGYQFLSPQYEVQDETNVEFDKARLENDEWTNVNLDKNENYNGEGFRQEQWHNYPRQLDRLREYLYEHYNMDKKGLNENEHVYEDGTAEVIPDELQSHETKYNELNEHPYQKQYDPGNPELNDIRDFITNNMETVLLPETPLDMDTRAHSQISSDFTLLKVKRDDIKNLQEKEQGNSVNDNKVVAKRIFSLWSRLQGLNHNRGHELHHRRHLHAFYGLPESDGGGGTLTAETRATLMRPPGSPLRWG